MSHLAGFSHAPRARNSSPLAAYDLAAARWPALPSRLVRIGGIPVTCAAARAAHQLLAAAGGVAVRQVLAAARSPLAACDYHAAAAPFLAQVLAAVLAGAPAGRGAAGRPVTRLAFMAAIAEALHDAARSEPGRAFAAELAAARAAFSGDCGYAAQMAAAAVQVAARAHAARQRAEVAAAVHRAVSECDARRGEFACAAASACGTGDCRLAGPALAALTVPAGPGRLPRPANHASAGSGFGAAPALAALQDSAPFAVGAGQPRPVRGDDNARASERAA